MKLRAAFLLLIAAVLFPAAAETIISVEAYPHAYLSFDDSFDTEPMRIQYGTSGSFTIYQHVYGPLFLTAGAGIETTLPSLPYGNELQKAFTSLRGSAGIRVSNELLGASVKAHGLFSTYTGTYVKFAHLAFSLEPYVTIITDPLYLSLLGIVGFDWRWDNDHNLYTGIGIAAAIPLRGRP
jgi:hypothetical protein